MGRKAVDVALLPEEVMMDRAIKLNAELVEKFGRKIVLNKENCLPHISLAMGCIDEGDVGNIKKVLKAVTKDLSLGDLSVAGVAVSTNAVGEKVSVLVVAKEKRLQLFHEKVLEGLAPNLSYDVTADMIYPSGEVAESTLLWIKNYREKSSFAKFLPHITIGYGEIEKIDFPIKFTASQLALCHLGNHCTCREILASVELKRR